MGIWIVKVSITRTTKTHASIIAVRGVLAVVLVSVIEITIRIRRHTFVTRTQTVSTWEATFNVGGILRREQHGITLVK